MFRDLNQYAESKDAYRDLAGYVGVPEQTDSPEQATDPTETKQDDADIVLPSVDFETLREMNRTSSDGFPFLIRCSIIR